MNCDKINQRLAEHVFNELDKKTAGEVSEHLRACAACREAADDMRRAAGLLREGAEVRGTPTLSEERRQALFAAMSQPEGGKPVFALLRKAKSLARDRVALGVAAVLAVCVLLAGALPTLTSLRRVPVADEVPARAYDMVAPTAPTEPPPPALERRAADPDKREAPPAELDDMDVAPAPGRREGALMDDHARAAPEEHRARGLREQDREPLRKERLEAPRRAREEIAAMRAPEPTAEREEAAAVLDMELVAPPGAPPDLGAAGLWQATAFDPVNTVGLRPMDSPYMVARSAIERGHFPPQVALRPDELVGAFDAPRPEREERPLAVETQAAPTPFDAGTAQLMINLRGSAVGADAVVDVTFRPERVLRQRLVGQGLVDERNAMVLFEIETDGAELRDFGEVRVRRLDAETQELQEIVESLPDTVVEDLDPSGDPHFYLAACAAEFAEILRGSEDARAAALDRLIPILEKVVDALPRDSQAAELLDLVRRARELAEP